MSDSQIVFTQIGTVHRKSSDAEVKNEARGLVSEVEIFPQYMDGLAGIEGFSHIFVLAYFNKLRPESMKTYLGTRPRVKSYFFLRVSNTMSFAAFWVYCNSPSFAFTLASIRSACNTDDSASLLLIKSGWYSDAFFRLSNDLNCFEISE